MKKETSLDKRFIHSVKGWSRNNMSVNTGRGQDRHAIGGILNHLEFEFIQFGCSSYS